VAGGRGQLPPPPKFWAVGKLSENFFLSESLRPKMQNFAAEKPPFWRNLETEFKLNYFVEHINITGGVTRKWRSRNDRLYCIVQRRSQEFDLGGYKC